MLLNYILELLQKNKNRVSMFPLDKNCLFQSDIVLLCADSHSNWSLYHNYVRKLWHWYWNLWTIGVHMPTKWQISPHELFSDKSHLMNWSVTNLTSWWGWEMKVCSQEMCKYKSWCLATKFSSFRGWIWKFWIRTNFCEE